MSKLIAAGCSYTHFSWPTWADYLGDTIYDSYLNLGAGGAGNKFIFLRISDMLEAKKITKDDTVIISWTGIPREDRILPPNSGWRHSGNIHWQDIYSDEWVKKYFSILGSSQDLMSYITTLDLALKQVGCEYIMTCMFPWHIDKFLGEPSTPTITLDQFEQWEMEGYLVALNSHYNKYLIPGSIEEYKWKIDSTDNYIKYGPDMPAQKDNHPSSWVHYKFALDVLSPLIKNNSKPKTLLESPELIANAKEWTSFYKSEEKVNSLSIHENGWELNPPEIKWLTSGKLRKNIQIPYFQNNL